jgi:type IX secretion system PorP/SprF family membrane protein
MYTKYIYGSVTALVLTCGLQAQDRHFSQYNEMSCVLNPALAGVVYDTRVIGSYRTQWGKVSAAYQDYGIAFEQAIKNRKLMKGLYFAVSASLFRDIAGDSKLSTLNPNLGFTGIVKLNKQMKFSVGGQGGFIYKTIDITNLKWDRQFNGYEFEAERPSGEGNVPRSSIYSYDAGLGVNFNYSQSEKFISSRDGNKANVGLAYYHFGLVNNSFFSSDEQLYDRVIFHAGGDINIPRSKNAIMPNLVIAKQGRNSEVLMGALFKFILSDQSIRTNIRKPSAFSIGAQYRYRDAIIPTVLWQYDKYAIGISYDINVSALTPASKRNGGLEVMLRYNTSPGYGKSLGKTMTKASY